MEEERKLRRSLGSAKGAAIMSARYAALKDTYDSNPKKCKNCGGVINYSARRNEFCSRPCSALYHNKKRADARKDEIALESVCLSCGVITTGHKFCNEACKHNYYYIKAEQEALQTGFYRTEYTAKRCLLQKYGQICTICGGSEWLGNPMPIVIDHINGNAMDNSLENIRLICPNCDTFTSTYKSRNKGKGNRLRQMKPNEHQI